MNKKPVNITIFSFQLDLHFEKKPFMKMILSPKRRRIFVTSTVAFLAKHNLDGLGELFYSFVDLKHKLETQQDIFFVFRHLPRTTRLALPQELD